MARLIIEPHPDLPGWKIWKADTPDLFFDVIGDVAVQPRSEGPGLLRWWPHAKLANSSGVIHGGALLGFADIALFAGAYAAGAKAVVTGVTVDLSAQFLGPGQIGSPLDAAVEVLRETGRLVFVRGLVEQGGEAVLAFSGTIRKMPPR